jgi:hypothetical protein
MFWFRATRAFRSGHAAALAGEIVACELQDAIGPLMRGEAVPVDHAAVFAAFLGFIRANPGALSNVTAFSPPRPARDAVMER